MAQTNPFPCITDSCEHRECELFRHSKRLETRIGHEIAKNEQINSKYEKLKKLCDTMHKSEKDAKHAKQILEHKFANLSRSFDDIKAALTRTRESIDTASRDLREKMRENTNLKEELEKMRLRSSKARDIVKDAFKQVEYAMDVSTNLQAEIENGVSKIPGSSPEKRKVRFEDEHQVASKRPAIDSPSGYRRAQLNMKRELGYN